MPASSGTGAGDPKSGNRGNDSARRWGEVDVPKLRKLAQDLIESHGADPNRIALFGYSNGAFFAQEAGLRYPDLFSAIVSIGGGCNVVHFPPRARDVGVYMIHGTGDRAVPVEVARKSVERLKTAGVSDVVLKEYPDRGHELFEEEMPAVFEWLEARQAN
jgi:phospholipase/carboxylesterase